VSPSLLDSEKSSIYSFGKKDSYTSKGFTKVTFLTCWELLHELLFLSNTGCWSLVSSVFWELDETEAPLLLLTAAANF